MENADRVFWMALTYTAINADKGIDQSTFFQKVEENQKIFSKLTPKRSKIRTMDRTKLGI